HGDEREPAEREWPERDDLVTSSAEAPERDELCETSGPHPGSGGVEHGDRHERAAMLEPARSVHQPADVRDERNDGDDEDGPPSARRRLRPDPKHGEGRASGDPDLHGPRGEERRVQERRKRRPAEGSGEEPCLDRDLDRRRGGDPERSSRDDPERTSERRTLRDP